MSPTLNTIDSYKPLKILFAPNDGHSNLTSLQMLANELESRGHVVIFPIDMTTKALIGFNGHKSDSNSLSQLCSESNGLKDIDFNVFSLSAIEVFEKFSLKYLWKQFLGTKDRDLYYKKLIEYIRPDLIIVESLICCPSLITSNIPWVWINFRAPNLYLDNHGLPPAWSGISFNSFLSKDSDNEIWIKFREEKNNLLTNLCTDVNEWCVSKGVPHIPKHSLHPHSPYLNVYVFPQELDYDLGETFPPKKWFRISSLMKANKDIIEIPRELASKPGKLIYLSLGAHINANNDLMKRLTNILSHSQNKFIISKGFNIEFPNNFYTFDRMTKTDAIRVSDLVFTNGDNNTITETLFWGKPLIVMPLYGDQLDNAQRVKDNGFGVILEPFRCDISTALGSINALLEDQMLYRRLRYISYKMQNTNHCQTLCALIEGISKP